MTSGNVSDEPIAYGDADAVERLRGIADLFLVHDRPIQTRTDDSVVRSLGALRPEPLMIRRSRGYVPASIPLPAQAPPLLACGAELKSAFCLAQGDRAWVSHHIGDLKNWETLRSFREGVEHFERLFAVAPEVVAHDLHPEYLSTKYALEREGVRDGGSAAPPRPPCRLPGRARRDGAGGGGDLRRHAATARTAPCGAVSCSWGTWPGSSAPGRCSRCPCPGATAPCEEPWRMACSWLQAAGAQAPPALIEAAGAERWDQVSEVARAGVASPLTSSMGRLFDAVGALCGLRSVVTYEGQAAVELEAAATSAGPVGGGYPLPLDGPALDARVTIEAVNEDLEAGASPALVAARFHAGVASGTAAACERMARDAGLDSVVLSGGVFQNRLLLELTVAGLGQRGLRVLVPERLPPNDGGIAYGQAAVAAARLSG